MTTAVAIYDRLVGGTIGNWFSIIGVLSLMYWAWHIVAAVQVRSAARRQRATTAARIEPAKLENPAPTEHEHIAVIAAAAHAVLGTHRIVHIETKGVSRAWEIEGRWMQHTSRRPR